MANRERGEEALVVGGTRYTLRLTTNACCELEEFADGRTIDQVMLNLNATGSRRDLRLFLWASLRDKHPDVATDDHACLKEQIGPIIDAAGGPATIIKVVRAFIAYNSAPVPDEKPGGKAKSKVVGPPDPSRAQAQSEDDGGASSETLSRSA